MKVKSKLFTVALLLSLILSVGAVVAQDDMTFEQSDLQAVSDETDMELSQEDVTESNDEDDSNSPLGGGRKSNIRY